MPKKQDIPWAVEDRIEGESVLPRLVPNRLLPLAPNVPRQLPSVVGNQLPLDWQTAVAEPLGSCPFEHCACATVPAGNGPNWEVADVVPNSPVGVLLLLV